MEQSVDVSLIISRKYYTLGTNQSFSCLELQVTGIQIADSKGIHLSLISESISINKMEGNNIFITPGKSMVEIASTKFKC